MLEHHEDKPAIWNKAQRNVPAAIGGVPEHVRTALKKQRFDIFLLKIMHLQLGSIGRIPVEA